MLSNPTCVEVRLGFWQQHLQQKWSIQQRSQCKMLGDGNRKNIWRFILRGVNCPAKWVFLGKIPKVPQITHFGGPFTPLRINLQIYFLFPSPSILHWLCCGILHFCWRCCFWWEICKTKWPFWRNSINKLLWDIMVTRWKILLKKPPLLAVSFKFMFWIDLFVVHCQPKISSSHMWLTQLFQVGSKWCKMESWSWVQ